MKVLRLAVRVVITVVVASGQAFAQQAAPVALIGVVSSQRVSTETVEGKAGIAKVQTLQQQKGTELRAQAQVLEATRQRLVNTKDLGEREALQREEQTQRAALDKATLQAQADLQSMQRQVSLDLTAKVKSVLEEILKGTKIQMVIQTESGVLWAMPASDLTGAVIEKLNARALIARKP